MYKYPLSYTIYFLHQVVISDDGKNLTLSQPKNRETPQIDPYAALFAPRNPQGQQDRDEVEGPLQIVQREMRRSLRGEQGQASAVKAPSSGQTHNPSFIPPRNFKMFQNFESEDISDCLRRLALKVGKK